MFYEQVPKAQKDMQSSYQYLFALFRTPCAKAATKMLVKFTPEMGFW